MSAKKDSTWKVFCYSVIVCSKKNPDYTTAFAYTPEDFLKLYNIHNENEALALVSQSCSINKTLVIK